MKTKLSFQIHEVQAHYQIKPRNGGLRDLEHRKQYTAVILSIYDSFLTPNHHNKFAVSGLISLH
jgi:hypothetical protein